MKQKPLPWAACSIVLVAGALRPVPISLVRRTSTFDYCWTKRGVREVKKKETFFGAV